MDSNTVILLLNTFAFLSLSALCSYIFLQWHKKRHPCTLGRTLLIDSLFFLFFAILSGAWSLKLIIPAESDAGIIYTIFILGLTATYLITVYQLTRFRNIYLIAFLYALSILGAYYTFAQFTASITFLSIAVMALASLDLVFFTSDYLKKAGFAGLAFFTASLAISLLSSTNLGIAWFIPLSFLCLFYYYISKDPFVCEFTHEHPPASHSLIKSTLKLLGYSCSLTFIILFAVIAIHELGHALAAEYYGCESAKAVVYDMLALPHTEIKCQNAPVNMTLITLAGLVITLLIGFLILLVRLDGASFSLLFLSFSIFLSYGDLIEMGVSASIVLFLYLIAISMLVYGYLSLTQEYLKKNQMLCDQPDETLGTAVK
ncbi:hypothetical protein HYV81_06050 [Candidatus Woesearchaeota archaeon]|nr:hypothetical protein [Candidatus Woesearchaeota archaeon]